MIQANSHPMKFGKFIIKLRDTYEVIELNHAFRINGVIDVYKNCKHVLCLVDSKRQDFIDRQKLYDYVMKILKENPYVDKSKPKNENKPNYKEFTKVLEAKKNSIDGFKPENYHWKLIKQDLGDDDLYFLFHDGFVKIGRTKNIDARLKSLKTALSCSYNCYLVPKMGKHENKFHNIFKELRHNREWFYKDVRFTDFIKMIYAEKMAFLVETYDKPLPETYKEGIERKQFITYIKKNDPELYSYWQKNKNR